MHSFEELLSAQDELAKLVPHGHKITDNCLPSVVAGIGVVEETLEYLNAIGFKTWRPNPLPRGEQLEELVDILHFFLELINFSGFSWEEVEREYWRKNAINRKRWADAKVNDYQWDKRSEKENL